MTDLPSSGVVEAASPFGFAATLDRVSAAIRDAGLTIFAAIDHAEGARQAGLAMPQATVLLYGHARGGTPIMLAAPRSALDLPLRVLVRETDGRTLVSFHPIAAVLRTAGVPDGLASRLDPAQRLLMEAIQP